MAVCWVTNPDVLLMWLRLPTLQPKLRISNCTRCLYTDLIDEKSNHFQFSHPGVLEIYRNPKQKDFFNSTEGFLRYICSCPWCSPQKALSGIEKFLLFWVGMNPLKAWMAKLEVANFFTT